VNVLNENYASEEIALREISLVLRDFYRLGSAGVTVAEADFDKAIAGVQAIYKQNVFPEMNVRFGTYASHIGHIDSPGCFRCHDDSHKSKDGRTISQDCDTYHGIQ
jgi:hypothetical protein